MENIEQRMHRTMALAGVVQAAWLVKQLAWKGTISADALNTAVHSIFQTDPKDAEEVYGERQNLNLGLRMLMELFADKTAGKDPEIARYTISLLHLERQLMKHPKMLTVVQRGVERAKIQATHFSPTHENVIANLASVYTDTLSTFKFRIHVSGESTYLSNTNVINKVRTILFAGIRSAVLWRQLGGSRWQIVFGKKTLLQDAKYILEHLHAKETADV